MSPQQSEDPPTTAAAAPQPAAPPAAPPAPPPLPAPLTVHEALANIQDRAIRHAQNMRRTTPSWRRQATAWYGLHEGVGFIRSAIKGYAAGPRELRTGLLVLATVHAATPLGDAGGNLYLFMLALIDDDNPHALAGGEMVDASPEDIAPAALLWGHMVAGFDRAVGTFPKLTSMADGRYVAETPGSDNPPKIVDDEEKASIDRGLALTSTLRSAAISELCALLSVAAFGGTERFPHGRFATVKPLATAGVVTTGNPADDAEEELDDND